MCTPHQGRGSRRPGEHIRSLGTGVKCQLWAVRLLLDTKPRSLARAVSTLNPSHLSSPPCLSVNVKDSKKTLRFIRSLRETAVSSKTMENGWKEWDSTDYLILNWKLWKTRSMAKYKSKKSLSQNRDWKYSDYRSKAEGRRADLLQSLLFIPSITFLVKQKIFEC